MTDRRRKSIRYVIVFSLCLASTLITPSLASAQNARFSAQYASGKRLNGADIFDWQDEKADPRLDTQKLFFPADRLLWIEDNAIAPAEVPESFVEFFGGDRLPGQVVEYRTGQESPYRKTPPCVMVASEAAIDWPEGKRIGGFPVETRWLRRVVWHARDDDRYRPGTLYYLDGRHIEFRGARWSKNSVRLLLEQETREVPFDEIAELHLPRPAPWEAWFDQLATLVPDGSGLVMQVETGDGVRATASTLRFSAASFGEPGKPENWYHALQPAWSVEPLWLRHRAIRVRRYFAPHEVPLSVIEPVRTVQRSNLAGGWNWERDRNVHTLPMRCADMPFSWGFGVHAYSELTFDLPPAARTFRTQYGLDRAVGGGGCVRAAVFAGPPSGAPLHRSEHVIGSNKVHETGSLSITGATQLTLVVDPAQTDRPAGADPFEIRDTFDWLHPVVELDPQSLNLELERRNESPQPGWQGWTLAAPKTRPCLVSLVWDQQRPPFRRCRVEGAPRDVFFSISRHLEIGEHDRYLSLAVSRLEKDSGPSRLQVKIKGRAAAEFDVPIHASASGPDPLVVPVDRFRGQTVEVEIVQIAQAPQSKVAWNGIGVIDQNPNAFEAFEDAPGFVEQLTDGEGIARFDQTDKFTGSGSARITHDDKNNPNLAGWNVPIRSEPNPGEYRFLRFAWKKKGGKQLGLHLAQNGLFAAAAQSNPKESFRYHIGRGVKHDYGMSVQLGDVPPEAWEVVTRDLFADFGQFDLTGLRLVAGDGDWAGFDHIYLGRRVQDLDLVTQKLLQPPADPMANLPPDVKASLDRIVTDPARYGEVVGQVAPAFSTSTADNGIWLFKNWQGRAKVMRTHPPEQGKPCILRAPVRVPANKHTELRLSVGHHPQADWQLLVFANGEKLHDSLVSESTAKEGWLDLSVDLSRFAGKNVVLEVHNHPNNWSNEFAYWSRVEVQ